MGAQMVKEVTRPVIWPVTAQPLLLFLQGLYEEGQKLVVAGNNPMSIKRGIDRAVETVVKELAKMSKPTKDQREITWVGTISAAAMKPLAI